MKMPCYPTLEAEIAKKGMKKKKIAEDLGIAPRTLSKKLVGETDFTLKEVKYICSLFPNSSFEKLFEHREEG